MYCWLLSCQLRSVQTHIQNKTQPTCRDCSSSVRNTPTHRASFSVTVGIMQVRDVTACGHTAQQQMLAVRYRCLTQDEQTSSCLFSEAGQHKEDNHQQITQSRMLQLQATAAHPVHYQLRHALYQHKVNTCTSIHSVLLASTARCESDSRCIQRAFVYTTVLQHTQVNAGLAYTRAARKQHTYVSYTTKQHHLRSPKRILLANTVHPCGALPW